MQQKTVLIVEDYEDARDAMQAMIEYFGHRVLTAENGLEALKIIAHESIDLILMDVSMPVMDGKVAIKVIKQHQPSVKVPVVAVTAHSGKYIEGIIDAGAAEIITKPIEMNVLKYILVKYL